MTLILASSRQLPPNTSKILNPHEKTVHCIGQIVKDIETSFDHKILKLKLKKIKTIFQLGLKWLLLFLWCSHIASKTCSKFRLMYKYEVPSSQPYQGCGVGLILLRFFKIGWKLWCLLLPFCFCQLEAKSTVDVVTKITLKKFCDQSNKQWRC